MNRKRLFTSEATVHVGSAVKSDKRATYRKRQIASTRYDRYSIYWFDHSYFEYLLRHLYLHPFLSGVKPLIYQLFSSLLPIMSSTANSNGDGYAGVPEAVEQLPANGLSVIVVGSGIGGLSAARELWRIGCEVRVLERRPQEILTGKECLSAVCSYEIVYRALIKHRHQATDSCLVPAASSRCASSPA